MTPEEWLALSLNRADKLLEIETNGNAIGDPIDAEITAIARELTKRYVKAFGSIHARNVDAKKLAPILEWLAGKLRGVSVTHVEKSIITTSRKAWAHGAQGAYIGLRQKAPAPKQIRLSPEVKDVARSAAQSAQERLDTAAEMVGKSERWGDLTKSLAKAKQAATTTRGASQWATNRSASDAVRAVERKQKTGVKRVWVAERDACLHCIAYAGETVIGEQAYPGGLTYAEEPISDEPVLCPPLHGYCRCHEELIRKDDFDIPAALKREARRSVAKGWSLPSESEKDRLKATEKLLAMNPSLPKSVISEAMRAVKRKEFRSRIVPTGNRPT